MNNVVDRSGVVDPTDAGAEDQALRELAFLGVGWSFAWAAGFVLVNSGRELGALAGMMVFLVGSSCFGVFLFGLLRLFHKGSPAIADETSARLGGPPREPVQGPKEDASTPSVILEGLVRIALLRYKQLESELLATQEDVRSMSAAAGIRNGDRMVEELAGILGETVHILRRSSRRDDQEMAETWSEELARVKGAVAAARGSHLLNLRDIAPPPEVPRLEDPGDPNAFLEAVGEVLAGVRAAEVAVRSVETRDGDDASTDPEAMARSLVDYLTARCASESSSPVTDLLRSQLKSLLGLFGWSLIDVVRGGAFNGRLHHRTGEIPTNDQAHNTIHSVQSLGYTDATGKVLKRAEVTVAVEPAP